MTKTFDPLYKKTSTGKIQIWQIKVDDDLIVTRFGLYGGNLQTNTEQIEGKNIGRSNETSPNQQALLEAESTHLGKLKSGYVNNLSDAHAGKTDDIIEGGAFPMLAHKFKEQRHKIQFPALVQPKLDGHRCIAVVKDGRCTLWSRTRKPILSMQHIIDNIEARFPKVNIILDGELYNHKYHDKFEYLTHLIKRPISIPDCQIVQYHVYDIVDLDLSNADRNELLSLFCLHEPLVCVETSLVKNEDEMMEQFAHFMSIGYEGCMVRNLQGKYINKRSYDLQKVKEFDDAEFVVVGVKSGKGSMEGRAIFECRAHGLSAENFSVKMVGPMKELEKYLIEPSLAIGKLLTVKYQGLTKNRIPRFPVALRFAN